MAREATEAIVGVVVVSWNVRPLLDACLQSVLAGPVACRVVVVDNASTDDSVTYLRRRYPAVAVIANRENVGYSRAVNQGLRMLAVLPPQEQPVELASQGLVNRLSPASQALVDLPATAPDGLVDLPARASEPLVDRPPLAAVLLLNPDAQLLPGALPALWARLQSDERIGCVGPRLVYPDGRHQPSMRRFPSLATALLESTPLAWHWSSNPVARRYRMQDADATVPQAVDWVTGAVMLLRSRALEQVAGLDESFFLYSEELDLCRRLHAAGWKVYYEPGAVAIHHEAASSDQVGASRQLWFQQSRMRYYAKHHGRRTAIGLCLVLRTIFAAEMLLEGAKLLVGHKRALRRARVGAYWDVVRHLGAIGAAGSLPRLEA